MIKGDNERKRVNQKVKEKTHEKLEQDDKGTQRQREKLIDD